MAKPAVNGRTEAGKALSNLERSLRTSPDREATSQLLDVSSQLSRKLSWALSTAWESATGNKPPRGVINDMASKYAVELTLALRDSFPLHLTDYPAHVPDADAEGA